MHESRRSDRTPDGAGIEHRPGDQAWRFDSTPIATPAPGADVSILRPSRILSILVVLGVALALIHPSPRQYRGLLVQDGRHGEAARLLSAEIDDRGADVPRLRELADLEQTLGRFDDAMDHLRLWALLDTLAVEPRERLGRLALMRHGQGLSAAADGGDPAAYWLERAITWYAEALALAPGVGDLREQLVRCHRWAGQPSIAADLLLEASISAPAASRPLLVRRAVDLKLEAGESRAAAEILDRHLAGLDPSDGDLAELLEIEILGGRPDLALPLARQLVERQPRDRDAHERLTQLLVWTGDLDGAFDVYRTMLRHDPRDGAVRQRLLKLGLDLGRLPELHREVQRLAAIDPGWWEADLHLARLELSLGRVEQSIAAYRRHLARRPGDDAARYRLAKLYASVERFEPALVEMRAIESRVPDNAEIAGEVAQLLVHAGQLVAADVAYDALLERFPHRPELVRQTERWAQARWRQITVALAARRMTVLEPDEPRNWLAWSEALVRIGDENGAVDALRWGMDRHPESIPLLRALVVTLEHQDRHAEAQPWLAELRIRQPDDPTLVPRLARAAILNGELATGRSLLEGLEPTMLDHATLRQVAWLYGDLGDHATALTLLEARAARQPNDFGLQEALLRARQRAGHRAAALAAVQPSLAAARTREERLRVLELATGIAESLAERRLAAAFVEQALVIEPDRYDHWVRLARLRHDGGDTVGARLAAERALATLAKQYRSVDDGTATGLTLDRQLDTPPLQTPPLHTPLQTLELHVLELENLELQMHLATVHEIMGRQEQATLLLAQLVAQHPREPEPALELARLEIDARRYATAERAIAPWLAGPAPHRGAAYFQGVIHMRRADHDRARRVFAELARSHTGPTPNPYVEDWAYAAAASGDWPEALGNFEQLLARTDLTRDRRLDIEETHAELKTRFAPRLHLAREIESWDDQRQSWIVQSRATPGRALAVLTELRSLTLTPPGEALSSGARLRRERGVLGLRWQPDNWNHLRLSAGAVRFAREGDWDATGGWRSTWSTAEVEAEFTPQSRLTVYPAAGWNQPDDASTELMLLGGRRTTGMLGLRWRLEPRVSLFAGGTRDRIELEQDLHYADLATLELSASLTSLTERHGITISPFSFATQRARRSLTGEEIRRITPRLTLDDEQAEELLENLTHARVLLYGVDVEYHKLLSPRFALTLTVGGEYDKVGERLVGSFDMVVILRPRRWLELILDASTSTSDVNQVGEVTQRITFASSVYR